MTDTIAIHFLWNHSKDISGNGDMAENKKKRHGETDRKGSHAKNARTTTEFGDTVFCPHCIKNILLPVDNEDPGKFLSYHQRHCTAKSPRKRVVSEEPVGLEEFEARLDTSRGTKAADRESEWQDIAEDFDGAIFERRGNTAEDIRLLDREQAVLSSGHTLRGFEVVYSLRQIQKNRASLQDFDINVLKPSDEVFAIQQQFIQVFQGTEGGESKKLNFRNFDGKRLVDWKDLVDLYDFGLRVGLSDREGDNLLAVINEILSRNESPIQLRNTWRSIRLAIDKQKARKCYHVYTLKEPLPSRFYGTHHYLSKRRLRTFTGTFEDIRGVVAEMLLNVDPSKVVLEYTPDDAAEEDQLLGAFPTGKLFQQYSEDAKNYGTINRKPVVPLCFGVWADETTTSSSRNTSELPVYIALLNAGNCGQIHCIAYKSVFHGANDTSFISFTVGDAYKMHLLGYAPFRLPHSDDTLKKQLMSRGLTFKNWRANVIRRTRVKVLRDFITSILKPLFAFGANCFQVVY